MRYDRILACFIGIAVLGAAACLIPVYIDDPRGIPRSGPAMFEKTVPLDRGGAIEVENPVGDVEIIGWDRNEVQISAEQGWDQRRGRRIDVFGSGYGVPQVDVEKDGDVLKISLRRDGRAEEAGLPVRFILNVPRAVDLRDVLVKRGRIAVGDIYGKSRLAVEEGEVRVENYSGSLDISVESGSAEAEVLDLRSEDVVRIACRQGPVTLFLESGVNARIEADAPNGRILSDFDFGRERGDRKISAVLGRGRGGSVTLTSADGDIRLRKVQ